MSFTAAFAKAELQDNAWQMRRDATQAAILRAHRDRAPLVMGILNVTPDSFSDGGRFEGEAALAHAAQLVAEGVDILDVGGESTRPGSAVVDEALERRRVEPALAAIAGRFDVACSIDTYKAATARAAIARGAVMVNDVMGLRGDPAMAETVVEAGALVVLMHNRARADAAIRILDDLRRVFDAALDHAERSGIVRARVVLDPGIGFGKTQEQNLDCIAHLGRLRDAYDLPILLGLSRKSFLGHALGRDVGERLAGTLAANLTGAEQGAAIIRVHDVAAHRDAVRMRAILAARREMG